MLDYFRDEKTAIEYYEQIRWNGKPRCPHCQSEKPYKTNRGYKCSNKDCRKKFTVLVGTIFQNTKKPLRIWFGAIYILTTSKKSVTSPYLAELLGITQKTAWFMMHRIREMLKEQQPEFLDCSGPIEVDEAWIDGKEKNKHFGRKRDPNNGNFRNDGTPYKPKKMLMGIMERSGQIVLRYMPSGKKKHLLEFINQKVPAGATIYTDENKSYMDLNKRYNHATILHRLSKYVDGQVHTNSIENFWSLFKRSIYGVHHQISEKHLHRYLNAFAAVFNARAMSASERMHKFLESSEAPLSYDELTNMRYD